MQTYITLSEYQNIDGVWSPPGDAKSTVDLTPPVQEADANICICTSDSPIDGHDPLYFGDPRDHILSESQRQLWYDKTGYLPPQNLTIAETLAAHLTWGSNPQGDGFAKPLIPRRRTVELFLDHECIYTHSLSKESPLFQAIFLGEVQNLADTLLLGEDEYRKALWVLESRYNLKVKDYLPLTSLPNMEPLAPSTTIIETWPNNGQVTGSSSVQDYTWLPRPVNSVYWEINANKAFVSNLSNNVFKYFVCDYAFAASNLDVSVPNMTITSNLSGFLVRTDVNVANAYLLFNNLTSITHYKVISGSMTSIGSFLYTFPSTPTLLGRCVGSSQQYYVNGALAYSTTDTSVSTGFRGGIFDFGSAANKRTFNHVTLTDNVSSRSASRMLLAGIS